MGLLSDDYHHDHDGYEGRDQGFTDKVRLIGVPIAVGLYWVVFVGVGIYLLWLGLS